MTQLAFELQPPTVNPKHRRVRETSKAAYSDGRERFQGRRGHVLRWLAAHFNWRNVYPTSGELAHFAVEDSDFYDVTKFAVFSEAVLYVRRGLSDLRRAGVAETLRGGDRKCHVTGSRCETWRVTQR